MAEASFYSNWYVTIKNVDDTFVDFLETIFTLLTGQGKPISLVRTADYGEELMTIAVPTSAFGVFKFNPDNSAAEVMFNVEDSIHMEAAQSGKIQLPQGATIDQGVLGPASI